MKEKKLVVFDMDGTLNRIELFIIPTYKEVLQKFAGAQAADGLCGRADLPGPSARRADGAV